MHSQGEALFAGAWPTPGLLCQGHKPETFGHATRSPVSEVSLPERSGDMEEDQERGYEHEPVASGVRLAPIMEGQPIDGQQQKTSDQHERQINPCHIYSP